MPRTKKLKEISEPYLARQTPLKYKRPRRRVLQVQRKLLGQHIVADPKICHGKPTFRGTRIMVWQVIEMLAEGLAWEEIIYECHSRISRDAIAEAIRLPARALF